MDAQSHIVCIYTTYSHIQTEDEINIDLSNLGTSPINNSNLVRFPNLPNPIDNFLRLKLIMKSLLDILICKHSLSPRIPLPQFCKFALNPIPEQPKFGNEINADDKGCSEDFCESKLGAKHEGTLGRKKREDEGFDGFDKSGTLVRLTADDDGGIVGVDFYEEEFDELF